MRAFNDIEWFVFRENRDNEIKNEIQNLTKEYTLGVEEEEYLNYLYSKYGLEELIIDYASEYYGEPEKITKKVPTGRYQGETYEVEAFRFTVSYNFHGSSEIFRISPSKKILIEEEIEVNSMNRKVSFFLQCIKKTLTNSSI